jgi:hypothetical protein
MSVITNVTVPVGNWAAEPTLLAPASEVGPEIGIADINPAKRGSGRLVVSRVLAVAFRR